MTMLKRSHVHNGTHGFTLVELLVTIAIFVAMTILVVSRYGAFSSGTLLTNLAYDVAISIRTAQTYGISVKNVDLTSNNFNSAYGVHFESNSNSFSLFMDKDNDGEYDPSDELISDYNIQQGSKISSLCAGPDSNNCDSNISTLTISFKRPNPEAIINSGTATGYRYARIDLQPSNGDGYRSVVVRENGQISVQ